jgi:hypothetical protein
MKRWLVEHPEMLPSQNTRSGLHSVQIHIFPQLPKSATVVQVLNRQRQAELVTNPININEFDSVPHEYKIVLIGKQFLLS